MKLKAVQYQNGYLFVDEKATECRFYLHCSIGGNHQVYDIENGGILDDFKRGQPIGWCIKIVAQSPELSIEGVPYVELEEEYLCKLNTALTYWKTFSGEKQTGIAYGIGLAIEFYKAAQAKKYTEEDLRKALEKAKVWKYHGNETTVDEIIQSIRPKIESIELETKTVEWSMNINPTLVGTQVPVSYTMQTTEGKVFNYYSVKEIIYKSENRSITEGKHCRL